MRLSDVQTTDGRLLARIPIRTIQRPTARMLAVQALPWLQAHALIPAALFAGSLALYVKTAASGVFGTRSTELVLAAATGGIPRPAGQPLFLLLTKLLQQLLPFGDAAHRAVVATALWAALTPVLMYVLLRELTVPRLPAILATSALAVAGFQWSSAVLVGTASLDMLLLATVVWLLLRWQRSGAFPWLAGAVLTFGLSLCNDPAAVVFAPALTAYAAKHYLELRGAKLRRQPAWLAWRAPKTVFTPTQWALLAAVGVASLLPYLYLPVIALTHPQFDLAGRFDAAGVFHPLNLASIGGFVRMVGSQAGDGVPTSEIDRLGQLAGALWGTYLGVGLAVGLAGLRAARDRDRPLFWLLAAIAVPAALLAVAFGGVYEGMGFSPLLLLWTVPMAFGIEVLARMLAFRAGDTAAKSVLAAAIVALAVANYPLVNVSGDQRPREWATSFLNRLPPDTTAISRPGLAAFLRYEQLVDGVRPDVRVVDTSLISAPDLAQLVQSSIDQRPLVVDHLNVFTSAAGLEGICGNVLGPTDTQAPALPFPGHLLVHCGSAAVDSEE